ncbi:MAG: hypothetical protein K9H64_18705 [Bacteroidales bacterium]|nr:hypothetical protein [Bacteroidales bacterium]MCF8458087.1 hypothetical protein [Bacteroidales bacterium]
MNSQFDENRKGGKLSVADMKSYLEGQMDAAGMYELESRLEEDGFQAAAMEGYENNPGAINDLDALKAGFYNKLPDGKSGFWQRYGVYLSAAAVVIALFTSIALFYYFQPESGQISQNRKVEKENPPAIEKTKPLPSPIDEKEENIAPTISKEKKKIIVEEKNQETRKKTVPQKSTEKKALPIAEKDAEKIAPAANEDAIVEDELQYASTLVSTEHSYQIENNLKESEGITNVDKGLVYKKSNMHEASKRAPTSVESQTSFNDPASDLVEINRNETKVTYLLDLKVIDYTQIYENQIERTKILHNTGVDARYANKREKMERASYEEQVIDSVMYIDILQESLAKFKVGAYEKSLNDFAIILKKHPEELNAKFYGGLAYFEVGDYVAALKNFDYVIEHPINVFNPESEWYKAQSLVRLGKLKLAENLLEKIYTEKGFYAEKAKELLEEIR